MAGGAAVFLVVDVLKVHFEKQDSRRQLLVLTAVGVVYLDG